MIAARSLARATIKESRRYQLALDEVLKTQWLGKDALDELGRIRLRSTLVSLGRVPYYREFLDAGRPPEGLSDLPVIDKMVLRTEGQRLCVDGAWPRYTAHSSGTSGTPVKVYQDAGAIAREQAFVRRQLYWAGFRDGDRRAWLRGDMIVPVRQSRGPYWRHDRAQRMLMLSAYHLSRSRAEAYLDRLARFDPTVIQAYPTAIGFLAEWMEHKGREYAGARLKGIVTSSEVLTPETRACVERRFGCRVYDRYGSVERVVSIGTCEHGRYHLLSDYGHLETRSTDGGEEIIGTSFNNRCMPLVRYRTGDLLHWPQSDEPCGCGRKMPLVAALEGRRDDYIATPDGRRIARLGFVFHGVQGVLQGQIVQQGANRLTVRVVTGVGFNRAQAEKLAGNLKARVGGGMAVAVETVDELPRTRNGKIKMVVREVAG